MLRQRPIVRLDQIHRRIMGLLDLQVPEVRQRFIIQRERGIKPAGAFMTRVAAQRDIAQR